MLNDGNPVFLSRRTTNLYRYKEHAVRMFPILLDNRRLKKEGTLTDPLFLNKTFMGLKVGDKPEEKYIFGREYAITTVITPQLLAVVGDTIGITSKKEGESFTLLCDLTNDELAAFSSDSLDGYSAYGLGVPEKGQPMTEKQRETLYRHTIIMENLIGGQAAEMFSPNHLGTEAVGYIPDEELRSWEINKAILDFYAVRESDDIRRHNLELKVLRERGW